jgi:hypothetical protein
MHKTEVLNQIREKHEELTALLGTLDEAQLTQPDVYGDLSVKDVVAHIVAWERMMLRWLANSQRGEPPERFAPGYVVNQDDPEDVFENAMNGLNDKIFRENKDRLLADVLADFQATHADVMEAVGAAPDADLFDPDRFAWRMGSPFINAVEGNTYGHYEEHIDLIRAWLNDGRQT